MKTTKTTLGLFRHFGLSCLLMVCTASTGFGWEQVSTTGPSARLGHVMAFDSANRQIMLFGGVDANGFLNDTWEWDGHSWNAQSPATKPPELFKAAMASDTKRHRVVLFGGFNSSAESGETWEWNGQDWTQLFPVHSPPARFFHAMAYDSHRRVTVLFGGITTAPGQRADLGDTWEWNGKDWTQLSPVHSPPARDGHALAYDAKRKVAVLFGGAQDINTIKYFADTWEWDGTDWKDATPSSAASSPQARGGVAMTYDEVAKKVITFGGLAALDKNHIQYFNDTWSWDGTSWSQYLGQEPDGRTGHAVAYDLLHRSGAIMFGGETGSPAILLGDTWKLELPDLNGHNDQGSH